MFARREGDGPGRAAGLCRQPSRHPADRRQVRRRARRARRAGGGALAERPRHQDEASDRRHQLDQRGGRALCAGDAGVGRVRRRASTRTMPMSAPTATASGSATSWSGSAGRATSRSARARCTPIFELHIEQGPILEAEGMDIGVVTHWPGAVVARGHADRQGGAYRLDADGDAASTPGSAMARIIELVQEVAMDDAAGRGRRRSGRWRSIPNSRNVIAGRRWSSPSTSARRTRRSSTGCEARIEREARDDLRGARRRVRDRAGRAFRSGDLRRRAASRAVRGAAERLGLFAPQHRLRRRPRRLLDRPRWRRRRW